MVIYAKETVREVWWPVGHKESEVQEEQYCVGPGEAGYSWLWI